MKRNSIWIIIGLMSFALLGIIFIQIFWINWFVKLNEKNFDDRVYTALNQVRIRLTDDAEKPIDLKIIRKSQSNWDSDIGNSLGEKYGSILNKYDRYTRQKLIFELKSLSKDFNPQELLYKIKPADLGKMLREAIQNQGLDLNFDYGVFSTESQDFILINDSYVPVISNPDEVSQIGMLKSLYNTKYKVQLFTTEFENPGHLALFFKNKTSFLWSSVMPWMVGSFLFTGLILFCFSYVIYVNFKQKKVGEMKTDFINNMTHEFKTPIATISLASDSIKSPKIISAPEKVSRFVNIIKQENARMLSQVEKVLQMAQIEKQDFQLNISEVNILDILNQVIANTELKIKARDGSFEADLNIQNPIFHLDGTHISNILHNLLDNANKYSPNAPEIELEAKDTEHGLFVSVKDHGIGIKKDDLKYIFDKFYRVHTGNLHDVKGFGLGLSYVKIMTEAHRGKVTVESKLNEGSTFHLFLPRRTE